MVVHRSVDNRWIRRYKACFIIGLIILVFQLYWAIKLIALNFDKPKDVSKPINPILQTGNDGENSVNFAKKLKDGLNDDEDFNMQKPRKLAEKESSSNMSKQYAANYTKLRLEELEFIPVCDIHTREAISAIHRAKTQKCKEQIANITCLIQKGQFYPEKLPNNCPSEGFVRGKSLGCYKDEKNFRLLNGYYGNNKNINSPEYCMNLCLQSGFQYAGVQYS